MELERAMMISASGLRAQSMRMRVIAENLANADSTASQPGEDPYRRKMVSFAAEMDKALGVETVKLKRVEQDQSDFGRRYDPGHPAADENGYVLTTNVETLVEAMDMRAAQRTYQSNLNAIEAVKTMTSNTLELLR